MAKLPKPRLDMPPYGTHNYVVFDGNKVPTHVPTRYLAPPLEYFTWLIVDSAMRAADPRSTDADAFHLEDATLNGIVFG